MAKSRMAAQGQLPPAPAQGQLPTAPPRSIGPGAPRSVTVPPLLPLLPPLLPALLLAVAAPAAAQPALTAEAAIARQRDELVGKARIGCRRSGEEAEIVVCGRDGADPNRVAVAPAPGERVRLLPGEPPSAVAAMGAGLDRCSAVGPNQNCGGGLDLFRVGSVLFKIGKHLLGKDD